MKKVLCILISLVFFEKLVAQHEHHAPEKKQTTKPVKKKTVTEKRAKNKPAVQKISAITKSAKDSIPHHKMDTKKDSIAGTGHMHHIDSSKISNKDLGKPDTIPVSHQHHTAIDTVPKDHSMHDHHGMTKDTPKQEHMPMDMAMSHSFSLNLPMNRNGSGTAWLPDASPVYGYMFHSGKWMYMLHGNIFLRYTSQDFTNKGTRGDSKIDAPSWFMFMGQRQVGSKGLFHFNTMLSLDPIIEGGAGYPLLFQSGETYQGKPIVDRQHPHDLFSELSVSYSYSLSKKADLFVYVGYPGEPALGPVAFMHRPSSLDNPDAPLSHHWVDATHITFGVATLGFRYDNWKIEGSAFTGREADENRYNLDKPKFDSYSGRVSFNPSAYWAVQLSHAFIKSPEILHPGEDVRRTTASVIYSMVLPGSIHLNVSSAWGMNKSNAHEAEHAFLLEGGWKKKKMTIYTRYEWVQKSTEELVLDELIYGEHTLFPVKAITVGFSYDLLRIGTTRLAGGSQFTQFHSPEKLNSLYGENPMAIEVYLRFYPFQIQKHR